MREVPKIVVFYVFILPILFYPLSIYADMIGDFFAFPNPSNMDSTITIHLNNSSNEEIEVTIDIYALSGKRLAVIVENEKLSAGGELMERFNADINCNVREPGLYLLKAEAVGSISEKREIKTFKLFINEGNE